MSTVPNQHRINYTPEEIAKVNAALEAVNGNRTKAALVLEWPAHRVAAMISSNASLNAKWKSDLAVMSGEPATNEESSVNRKPPQELALSPTEKHATALVVQEKNLKRSLGKLGFKSTEIEALASVEEFAGQHFKETLSVMHGGMLKGAMRLMMLADRIERDYLQSDDMDEKERKWWWDTYFRILESLRLMNDQSNKAALTKAMIEIKEKEAKAGISTSGKAGFSPMTTAVQVNVSGVKDVSVSHPPNATTEGP